MTAVVALVAGAPAGAHARIVGSSPEDGATVDRVPDELTVEVDAKPATIEGDPLQVYAPDGRRIDLADPRVSDDGRRLTVGIGHDRPLPGGEYQVAYRIVSADSHVITGRLSFSAPEVVMGGGAAAAAAAQDRAGSGSASLVPGGPEDLRPPLLAAGAIALTVLTLLVRRRRRTHAVAERARAPHSGRRAPIRAAPVPRPGAPDGRTAPGRDRPTRGHLPSSRPRHRDPAKRPAAAGADRRRSSNAELAFWAEAGPTIGRRRARARGPAGDDAWWLRDEDGTWR